MPFLDQTTHASIGFPVNGMMMRYSVFVPRLYNFCKSLGFETGKIMPSRAFCSDENQGYPIIMLAKHFGTFPFNHGRVGGIVALDRHGPHAEHGQDMVLIQASHVGYDPVTREFGQYRRRQTSVNNSTATCGKLCGMVDWYLQEYLFAREYVVITFRGGKFFITFDNLLLDTERENGLFLDFEQLVEGGQAALHYPGRTLSTARSYRMATTFSEVLKGRNWQDGEAIAIGDYLTPELFHFKRHICTQQAGGHHLEQSLLKYMPAIVTSATPSLVAAQITTQIEFDRTFRSLVKEQSYKGKRLVFISGLNIDISPQEENIFPLTKFVPWAAYIQEPDGSHRILEQAELMAELSKQSSENPDQIDLEMAMSRMAAVEEVRIEI